MLIRTLSVTAAHGPLFVDVSVKITKPPAMSSGENWYALESDVLPGLNVPVPVDVQIPLLFVPPATIPFRTMVPAEEQTGELAPAITVGELMIRSLTVSDLAAHTPLFVEVRVKIIVPAAISPAVTE